MKTQPNKPRHRVSDNVYITLGLVNRYGAAVWMLLSMALIAVLIEYGWTEEKGGMIAAGILMLSVPVSFIMTGLYDLLGGIFQRKGPLCAVQSMYRQEMNPRKFWTPKQRRDMIIAGSIFTVLGTALLLAWIFGL